MTVLWILLMLAYLVAIFCTGQMIGMWMAGAAVGFFVGWLFGANWGYDRGLKDAGFNGEN
jgi:hypothetical protein